MGRKIDDISGNRYGMLVAVNPTEHRRKLHIKWLCLCDCGNTKLIPGTDLKSGKVLSCGCLFKRRKYDISGNIYGRLRVLHEEERGKKNSYRWICQCECGNVVSVEKYNLIRLHTTSCGCLNKEKVAEVGRSTHKDISGNRYGRLVARERTDQKSDGNGWIWLCECVCGNKALVPAGNLKSGNTRSCGCLRDTSDEYLYAMQSEGLIKLGISRNPFRRMESLKTQLNTHVSILAYTKSSYYREKEFHRELEPYRAIHPNNPSGREWFYPSDEVMEVVRSMEFRIVDSPILS